MSHTPRTDNAMRQMACFGTHPAVECLADLARKLELENAELRAALEELSNMYALTWDRVDGSLAMMGDGVKRFEAAHRKAVAALAKVRG